MARHLARIGTLTILNGQTASNVLSSSVMSSMVGVLFITPAAFTGTVSIIGHPEQNETAGNCYILNKDGSQPTLAANRVHQIALTGIRTIGIQSGSLEGAQRDVIAYAILDIGT